MKLTKSEAKYICDMFPDDIKKISHIKELPLGWVSLFMENREEEPKEVWPADHSICEKYLTYHKLPLNMTHKQWDKWLAKQRKKR